MAKKTVVDGTQVVNFNAAVYGLSAIRKAAYKFRGDLCILVEQHGDLNEVWLMPNAGCKSASAFVREFCTEVLDQELRERVTAEMVGVRNLLLAGVFPKEFRVDFASAVEVQAAFN
jgi:His-Xaa-Ser system protein HxsD